MKIRKKKRNFWKYKMDINHYLFVSIRTSFMENSNSKWGPPSVQFFYPLMHHSSWTNYHCWTQSLVPKIKYSRKKNFNMKYSILSGSLKYIIK